MTFRSRLALLTAATVALVVAGLAGLGFLLLRAELARGVDESLQTAMAQLQRERRIDGGGEAPELPASGLQQLGVTAYYAQLVGADGRLSPPPQASLTLPATDAVRRLAAVGRGSLYYSAEVGGRHFRVLAEPYAPDVAVLVAAPVQELERTVVRAGLAALIVAVAGTALGGLAGHLVAGAAVRPVRRLTVAAEQVGRTGDLSTRLPVTGRDEISRLTTTFNGMLAALDDAVAAQRRLVADASHELRTPLTSLRTNVELLASHGTKLPAAERRAILQDAVGQARELGEMMTAILDLARGQEPLETQLEVAVEDVVERALASTRRDWPDVTFSAELAPFEVLGDPSRLERAVVNLLGNAAKYGGAQGPVEVVLRDGILSISDAGPGIPAAERQLVFERFHRSGNVLDKPGSGLGLAIVRQAVTELGGAVSAGTSPSGGALLTVDLRTAKRPTP